MDLSFRFLQYSNRSWFPVIPVPLKRLASFQVNRRPVSLVILNPDDIDYRIYSIVGVIGASCRVLFFLVAQQIVLLLELTSPHLRIESINNILF